MPELDEKRMKEIMAMKDSRLKTLFRKTFRPQGFPPRYVPYVRVEEAHNTLLGKMNQKTLSGLIQRRMGGKKGAKVRWGKKNPKMIISLPEVATAAGIIERIIHPVAIGEVTDTAIVTEILSEVAVLTDMLYEKVRSA